MATWFTPGIPMCGPTYDPEKMIVMTDIPAKLKTAQKDGLKQIGIECVRQNAEVVLRFFESVCAEHVIEMQMEARLVRQLTQRSAGTTETDTTQLVPAGRLARSSLLARDICGDEAAPEPDGVSSEPDADTDTTTDEAASSSAKATDKKKKEHTRLQVL